MRRKIGLRDYDRARTELEIARPGLPNSTPFFILAGYMSRRQNRWAEGERDFKTAAQLDPRKAREKLGWTHATDLDGGFQAWKRAGWPVNDSALTGPGGLVFNTLGHPLDVAEDQLDIKERWPALPDVPQTYSNLSYQGSSSS